MSSKGVFSRWLRKTFSAHARRCTTSPRRPGFRPTLEACEDRLVPSSISTTVSSGSVTVGGTTSDSATVSGLMSASSSDTVTFNLYSSATTQDSSTLLFSDTETVTLNGSTATATSNNYTTTAVGTDYWVAAYSGDGNNNPTSSTAGAEPVTVGTASPSIGTTVSSGSVTVGGATSDTATVSGGYDPTGTVTFNLYNNPNASGTPLFTDADVSLSGGAATSSSYTTTAVGTDYWVAAYSGDGNNNPTSSTAGAEPVTVGTASPSIGTTVSSGSVTVGGATSDTATVSGGYDPTGTVTFNLYNNPNASGTPLFTDADVSLSGGAATSSSYTTTAVGTDYWVAAYSGDGNNNPTSSTAGAEPVTVGTASPSIGTTVSSGSVTVGGATSDTATVSGGYDPTGTVTFNLYNNPNASGTPLFTDADVSLSGGAATSSSYTTTAVGTDYWVAAYSGDGNNNPTSSTAGAEPVTVGTASPSIGTTVSSGSVTVGGATSDTATVSGGYDPTGTVTFNLYNNPNASGTPLFTDADVSLSGGAATSSSYTTTAVGTDYWVAAYSGDGNNNPTSSTAGAEPVTVGTASPSIGTTVSSGSVTVGGATSDTATVSGGYDPTGTVTFNLYNNPNASGTPLFTDADVSLSGGAATSSSYTTTAVGTDYWVAAYSGDGNNNPTSSTAGAEPVTVGTASPSIGTTVSSGSVTVGGATSDTATVSGGYDPTGTVTFNLYNNPNASGTPLFTDADVSLSGGAATSSSYTTTAVGTDYWVAAYSGDGNNNPTSSTAGAEPVTVGTASPSIGTTVSSGSVTVGGATSDTATVSGGYDPTGTVTFNLYNNPNASGTPLFTDADVSLSGGAATSSSYTTTAVGTDYWVAAYSGDGNNNPTSSTAGAEPVTVGTASPSIGTTVSSGSVTVGGATSDTATVSGGYDPTGTVTFNLYNNPNASGTPLFTDADVSLSGGAATSSSYTTTAVGTDYWVAAYSGDGNNNPTSSTAGAEPVTVGTASPSIGTTVSSGSVTVGGATSDTATVSGGYDPTGTVTFNLYNNPNASGTPLFTDADVSLSGGAATSSSYTTTAVGTDYWVAAYSGDGNNNPTSSTAGAEPVTVGTASPSIGTTVSSGSVTVGGATSDTATVSGGYDPTGTVTFNLYNNPNASGTPLFTDADVSLSGGAATSSSYTTTAVGTDYWVAAYSGDGNNNPTSSTAGAEPVTVGTASPSIGTTVSSGSVTVGGATSDTATVSGGYDPTGTVTFNLYNNPNASGTPLFTDADVSLSGGAATSSSYTTTAVGTDYWVAAYSGDGNNNPTSSTAGAEPVTVGTASPSIGTTVSSGSVTVGGATSDTATVSGGYDPTGTVTFNLYNNPNASGTPLFTDADVSLSGGAATSSSYTTTAVGTDYWVAAYSGDGNNNPTSSTAGAEPVTVGTASPSIGTTVSSGSVTVGGATSDTATVSGGYDPTGTVTFNLYNNPNASGTPLFTDADVSLSGGAATSSSYTTTAVGTDYWVAAYSGDGNNNPTSSTAGAEPVTVGTASPSIGTTVSSGSVTVGGATSDTATVSGGYDPTGTVTFNLYNNPNASGTPLFTDADVSLSGGAATSSSYTTTAVGTDYWVAAYSGDGNNNPTSSTAGAEPVTVGTASPSIGTTVSSGSVTVGGATSDTATVSGGYDPTGTVTFNLYNNPNASGTPLFTDADVSLSGGAATSSSYTTTAVGTDYWVAAYSGDGNNNPTSSTAGAEPVTVGTASPSIGTTVSSGSVTVGGATSDTATVSGGYDPTGTVTFNLYNNPNASGTPLFTDADVSLSGGAATSSSYTTTAVGTDYWVAAYSGDGNNNPTSSTAGAEPVTVGTASPSIGTTVSSGSVTVGGATSDTATVSGGYDPTGTVTFNLYNNPNASGTPLFTDADVSLSGGAATSSSYTTTAVGTDYWVAAYSGDGNNNPTSSTAGAEPVTVGTASPSIGTTVSSGSVTVGGATSDTATVSGGYDPTGTVTFNLYNNPNASGTPLFTDADVSLSGGAATSSSYTTTAVGTDYWVAAYSGDGNNNPTSSTAGAEPVTVNQAQPTFSGENSPIITYGQPTTTISGTLDANADGQLVTAGEAIAVTIDGNTQDAFLTGTDQYSVAFNTATIPASATPYTITLNYAGDTDFLSASDTSSSLTVNQAQPTFSGQNSPTITYGTPTTTISGTLDANASGQLVTSGEAIAVTIDGNTQDAFLTGTDQYSVAFNTATIPASATPYTITLNYAGDTDFFSASDTSSSLTVNQAQPTFSGQNSPTITYGTPTTTISGTLDANASGQLVTSGEAIAVTIDGNTQDAFLTGTDQYSVAFNTATIPASATPYTITLSYAGDTDFLSASDTSSSLTVNQAQPTFSGQNSPTITYGTPTTTISGTLDANASGQLVTSGEAIAVTIDGNTQDAFLTGTDQYSVAFNTATIPASATPYTITLNYAGDTDFLSASDTSSSLTVNQAQPTFSGQNSPTITYGTPTTTISGTLDANASGQLVTSGEAIAVTIDGNTQDAFLTGTDQYSVAFNTATIPASATPYTITLSYAGDTDFFGASDTSSSLTVNQAQPTFSGQNSPTITYGTPTTTISGTLDANASGQLVTSGEAIAVTIDGNTQDAFLTGTDQYSVAFNTATIPASATPYTITLNYAGDTDFLSASDTSSSLTVNQAQPTFSGQNSPTITYGTPTTTISGTLDANASGQLVTSGEAIAVTIDGNTQDAFLTGTDQYSVAFNTATIPASATPYTITLNYAGDTDFLSASDTSSSLTVNQAQPTFSGQNSPTITYGTPTTTISGTLDANASGQLVTSGEAIAVTIDGNTQDAFLTGTDQYSVAFNTATIPASATPYTITLNYAGDTDFLSASDVSSTLTVNQAQPTFSGQNSPTITYGTPTTTISGTLDANASGQLVPAGEEIAITIDGNTQDAFLTGTDQYSVAFNTATIPASATPYTITLNYAGDTDFKSATDTSSTLTVNQAQPTFSGQNSPTITYGTPTTTISGTLDANASGQLVPAGEEIAITIDGNTQDAFLTGTDQYSVAFNTATIPASATPYTITLNYAGDTDFKSATDTSSTLTVNQAQPTFSGQNSPTITYGTPTTTISGTLDANADGQLVPAGETIAVTIDGNTQDAFLTGTDQYSVAFNTATIPASATPYTITLNYAGDTDFFSATDTSSTLTVNQAQPTFSGQNSPTITYGTPTTTISGTLDANADGQLVPAGETIAVTIDGNTQDAFLTGTDQYSVAFNTATIPASATPYTITLNYAGDTDFLSASDTSSSLTVNQAQPTFSGQNSPTITYGQPTTTISGTLDANADGQLVPAGEEIAITIDGNTQDAFLTGTDGYSVAFNTATIPASATPYTITLNYAGDTDFKSATDTSSSLTVNQAQPTFSNLNSPTITYGQPTTTISGTLDANASGQLVPKWEEVAITIDGVTEYAAIDAADNFSLAYNTSIIPASATPYTVGFSYGGDTDFKSASTSSTLTVNKATPYFSVSNYTIAAGTASTTVSGTLEANASGQLVPSGETIAVTLDGVTQYPTLNSSDQFSTAFKTSSLTHAGSSYTIGYSYAGDSNFNSASDTSNVNVTTGALSYLTSTVTTSLPTIQLGGVTTVTLQTKDAYGNDLTTGGLKVAFSLNSKTGAKGTFGTVSYIGNGAYSATFTGTADSTNEIKATIGGSPVADLAPISATGAAVSVSKSTITLSPASISMGGTTTITLQAEDAKGDKETSGGLTVVFKLASATGAKGTFSAVTDHDNGTYTATFTGTVAGSNTITATIDGSKAAADPTIKVAAAVAAVVNASSVSAPTATADCATSLILVSAPTVSLGGTTTVTFQAKNAAGQDLTTGGLDVVFFLVNSSGGSGKFGTVTDHHNGTYTVTFAGTVAGDNAISADIDGDPLTSPPASIDVT